MRHFQVDLRLVPGPKWPKHVEKRRKTMQNERLTSLARLPNSKEHLVSSRSAACIEQVMMRHVLELPPKPWHSEALHLAMDSVDVQSFSIMFNGFYQEITRKPSIYNVLNWLHGSPDLGPRLSASSLVSMESR